MRAGRGGLSGTTAGLGGADGSPRQRQGTIERQRDRERKKKSSSTSPPGRQHIILTAPRGRRGLAARHSAITCALRGARATVNAHAARTAAHTRTLMCDECTKQRESLKLMWEERNGWSWRQKCYDTTQQGAKTQEGQG